MISRRKETNEVSPSPELLPGGRFQGPALLQETHTEPSRLIELRKKRLQFWEREEATYAGRILERREI